jgi:Na+/alanine symporter
VEHHAGFTAQLWGILYAMIGIALFCLAYAIWPASNSASDVAERVSNSPFLTGLVIVVVGAGIAMYGLTRLLAGKEAFVETGLSTTDRYVMGIYACLAGTLILAVGILQTFAPELLSALRHWIGELIKNAVQRL